MSNIIEGVFGRSIGSQAAGGEIIPPVLQSFYERVGPLPSGSTAKPVDDMPPPDPLAAPPFERHEAAAKLPSMVPGTNPVEHERDILFVVNYAMEHGGVRTMSDFAAWIQDKIGHMQWNRQHEEGSKWHNSPPDIIQLSRYLQLERQWQQGMR
jgi:hypothetical protein